MEGVVEGKRREGEKGKNKEEKGGRALMEGEEGQRRGEALKNKQVQEGGGERKGGRRGGGGKVADILAGDHSSSAGHQSALLLCVPAKISTGT